MCEELVRLVRESAVRKSLFHFTDDRNLQSIDLHGLVSKAWANGNRLTIAHPGGNQHSREADAIKNLNNYVNLCFLDRHPMEYLARKEGRILNSKFIRVEPEVLLSDGVKITLDVANKSGVPLLNPLDAINHMDIDILFNRSDWKDPDIQKRLDVVRKYEILVPSRVDRVLLSWE